jgi:CRP-like cAMP-binding protein/HEAT repeat protein
MWGRAASLGLFMGTWGSDYLSYIFIGDALLSFALGLIYASFADKVSDARLLVGLGLFAGGCLFAVRIFLGLSPDPTSLVYPAFLLFDRAFRPIASVQILNYINGFYDTRAAKRVLPLMASAAAIGMVLAGSITPAVIDLLGVENIVLGWVVSLLLVIALVWVCERRLGQERQSQLAPALTDASSPPAGRTEEGRRKSNLDNLRDGFRFVRRSPFLRLLAAATLISAFIINLFGFQATWAIAQSFPSGEQQTAFYGMLGGVTNLLSLVIQVLFLSRLVGWLGVSITNLVFPITSLLTFGLLGISPNIFTAIGGRINATVVKQAFRNPIDAMLYNTVPIQVKGRARAFINGLIAPLGVFIAGGLLFLVPSKASLPLELVGLGIGVVVLYVALAVRLRGEYGRALVTMLEEEEFALYRLATGELGVPDAKTFDGLIQRLQASSDDDFTVFLAEVIIQAGGRQALPVLQQAVASGSARVRSALLTLMSEEGLANDQVRALCQQSLSDESGAVRRAAIAAWQRLSSPENQAFLTAALELLTDPDLEARAQVIPPLIQSGDFFYQAAAIQTLSDLLKSQDGTQRAAGIRVLGTLDDARFIRTLADYLDDPDHVVRLQAALAVERQSTLPMPEWLIPLALEAVQGTLRDPTERIRLAGVATLKQWGGTEARKGLIFSLADSSHLVRERAIEALQEMGAQAVSDLEAALNAPGQDENRQEAISIVLARIERERFAALIDRQIEYNLRVGHETLAALAVLRTLSSEPGALVLQETLWEYDDQRLERIFDLVAAVQPPQSVQVIAEHLRSPSGWVRANAVEALEQLTSPRTARLIAPLAQRQVDSEVLTLGQEEWEIEPFAIRQLLERYVRGEDPWLQTITVHVLGQVGLEWFSQGELDQIFRHCRDESRDRDVHRVVQIASLRLAGEEAALSVGLRKEDAVLSTIERVIFLKEVPIFENMTIEQLRILASVSEESTYDEDEVVFAEGDTGDALYIVVSGRIGIEQKGRRKGSVVRLATLSGRQYFGEMSIFDEEPRAASAIALEPTLLLSLRRAPLVALAREDPNLALELIRILSYRLREANRQIAAKSVSRPRELERLFDEFGEQ